MNFYLGQSFVNKMCDVYYTIFRTTNSNVDLSTSNGYVIKLPKKAIEENINGKVWKEIIKPEENMEFEELLKPFNLKEALKEPENVRFINGEKIIEFHYFSQIMQICNILCIDKNKNIRWERADTLRLVDDTLPSVYYHNVYEALHISVEKKSTLEGAMKDRCSNAIAVVKISIKGKEVTTEVVHTY